MNTILFFNSYNQNRIYANQFNWLINRTWVVLRTNGSIPAHFKLYILIHKKYNYATYSKPKMENWYMVASSV